MTDTHVELKDFTIARKTIPFVVDSDRFEAYAILGLPQLQQVVNVTKDIGTLVDSGNHAALFDVFDSLLLPDSAKRFRERCLSPDPLESLDVRRQVIPILHYLLEEYGVRPTQQSSDS